MLMFLPVVSNLIKSGDQSSERNPLIRGTQQDGARSSPSPPDLRAEDLISGNDSKQQSDRLIQISFYVATVLQALTAATFTIGIVVVQDYSDKAALVRDSLYASLVIINYMFTVFYGIHGVMVENRIEIGIFAFVTVCSCAAFIFSDIEAEERAKGTVLQVLALVRLIVMALLAIGSNILAFLCTRRFGWLQARIIGLDTDMARMYAILKNFEALSVITTHISVNVVLLTAVQHYTSPFFWILDGIFFLLIPAWISTGWVGVHREDPKFTIAFYMFWTAMTAFVIFTIVDKSESSPMPTVGTIVYFLVLCGGILVNASFLFLTVLCHVNYDKGLKEALADDFDDEY
eukprot:Clim_evm74s207 gene=Clim_evmTU74s207